MSRPRGEQCGHDQDDVLLTGAGQPWVIVGLSPLFGPFWELATPRQGQDSAEKASVRNSAW